MGSLTGILTAMCTPFAEDGSVDEAAARRLARHLVENGSDGVVVAGTTGESPTLDDPEILSLLREVKAEVGDEATVVCGAGSNETRHSAHLAGAAAEFGADAVLIVTPYYNKPNRAGIKAHFAAVAEAAGVPVIVYNIPSRVVVNIPPEDLAELAAEIPNVTAVKQANNDEMQAIDGMDVLAGNDDIFARCLEMGGTGGITVASHVAGPRMREIYDAAKAGDHQKAKAIEDDLRPLYDALAVTTNPIPIKAALSIMGLCSDRMRLPMVPADDAQREVVRAALEAQGLLDSASGQRSAA